jgi:endonuclease YncB( thermonuclease family)
MRKSVAVRCEKAWYGLRFEGTVLKVVDGDSIIIILKDGRRKRVDLAGVDASIAQRKARSFLSELVLNRSVNVLVNPSAESESTVAGVVHTQVKDVNRELLKAGVARYKKPKPYSLSAYTACVYRITVSEAREAKRGLWQRVGAP